MGFLEFIGGSVVVLFIFLFAIIVLPRSSVMLGIGYFLHREFDVAFTDISDTMIGVELAAAILMLIVMIILMAVDLLTLTRRWERLTLADMGL